MYLIRPGLIAFALCCGAVEAFAQQPPSMPLTTGQMTSEVTDGCHTERLPSTTNPAAVEVWSRALPECQRNADFLAQLGQILLQQRRYAEAAEHLERALMLEPDLKGAKVDYAIALAGVGDILSSSALIDLLLADAELPSGLRDSLQLTLAGSTPNTGWQKRVVLSGRVGHDSNLAGAPNLSSLTLTFPEGAVTLPLANNNLVARAGTYIRSDLQFDLRRLDTDGGRWDVVGSLRDRRSADADNVNSSLVDLNVEHSDYQQNAAHTRVGGGHYIAASLSALRAQPGTRYAATGVAAGWGKSWTAGGADGCQLRGGGEFQHRRHISNGLLSGRYIGFAATVACDTLGGNQWLVSARHGMEKAISDQRPGGDQMQSSLRLATFWSLQPFIRGTVLLDAEAGHYRDERGYSPLFGANRIRTIARTLLRVEYQAPIAKNIYWLVGAEWLKQKSSLDLFRLVSHGPYTSLRIVW